MKRCSPSSKSWMLVWLKLASCLLLAVVALGCGSSSNESAEAASEAPVTPPSEKLAIVYYQSDDPFSTAVRAGAEAAAEEFKRELEWHLPAGNDASQQTERFKQAISDKVTGICICPVDPISQMDTAQLAADAGIPVAVFERPMAQGPQVITFAGTDHFHCGKVLLEKIQTDQDAESQVLVLRHRDDHWGAVQRQQGIETTAKELDDVTLVLSAGELAKAEGSKTDLIEEWITANEDITAICALTAGDAVAATAAVRALEKTDQLPVFGFGATAETARLLQDGDLNGIILEDPYMMGYSAVMALVNHLDGSSEEEPMSDLIVTGEHLVTAETMSSERNQRLLETNLRNGIEN